MTTVEKKINPFDPDNDKQKLYNIHTGKSASSEITEFLIDVEYKGDSLRKAFISRCFSDSTQLNKL